MPPKVTICTSVLDQSELLRASMQSVIDQTFKEWQHVIVDDGSTEDIKAIVQSFNDPRIQYYRFPENRGVPHGSNFAFDQAIGEYVTWLAADERIGPDKLEVQVKYLDEHPGVHAVWGLPGYFAGQRVESEAFGARPQWEQYMLRAHNRSNEAWLRTLLNLEGVPLGTCSMLARRDVLKAIGPMDTNLKMFSDHEMYCRFFAAGYVGVVLPYRWALDQPATQGKSVREQNQATAAEELAYVRAKHQIPIPKSDGTITVGIPCFNHANYLTETVESILAQTKPVDEILILNDASTDNFDEVAQRLVAKDSRIKVMAFDENRGCQEAKTQMAYRAAGDFFMVLSADDLIAPTFVEKVMGEFEANPWIEFAATQTDFIDAEGKPFTDTAHAVFSIPQAIKRTREEWLSTLYPGNHYFGAGIYRTKMLSDVGGWQKEFGVIDDYEMYLKILQRENIGIVEEPLTHTRIHGKNKSINMEPAEAEKLPWLYHEARKSYYPQRMRVVIATPFYEVKAFSPYIVALVETIRLLQAHNIDWRFMELSGDSYVHRARNTMCDRFLSDPDATDLFFIDSDMSWDPWAFIKMCLLPDDLVGGSYPVKNGWDKWTSIPAMVEKEGAYHYHGRDLGDGTALLQAHVLAGGFLRIKRHVLERYREHYKDLWYVEPSTMPDKPDHRYTQFFAAEKGEGNAFYGEDHWFSGKIRGMNVPMFIYPNATISHYGLKDWTGNLDKWLKDKKYEADKSAGADNRQ